MQKSAHHYRFLFTYLNPYFQITIFQKNIKLLILNYLKSYSRAINLKEFGINKFQFNFKAIIFKTLFKLDFIGINY